MLATPFPSPLAAMAWHGTKSWPIGSEEKSAAWALGRSLLPNTPPPWLDIVKSRDGWNGDSHFGIMRRQDAKESRKMERTWVDPLTQDLANSL